MADPKFPIPAVDISQVDPKYFRRTVRYETNEAPGTIVVDSANYYVYRIEGEGNATRYGANVGRQGFLWSGEAYIGRKGEWPTWTPPKEMIKRQPEVAKYARGMPGGPENPLGARIGLRAGQLDRRSFLVGSAASFGALGLAGCVTSDGMSLA